MNQMPEPCGFDASEPVDSGPGNTVDDREAATQSEDLNPLAYRTAVQLRDESHSPKLVTGIVRVIEFLAFAIAGSGLLALLPVTPLPRDPAVFAIFAGGLLAALALNLADSYQVNALRSPGGTLPRAITAWTVALALVGTLAFVLGSRAGLWPWISSWYAAGCAFLMVERFVLARIIRRWARDGHMERRAVLVGGGERARDLVRRLESQPDNDIRICGIFDERSDARSPSLVAGYPKLGNMRDLLSFARLARIDMLIITLPLTAEARVLQLMKTLWVLPMDIRLAAHASQLRFRSRSYSYVGQVPMLDLADRPIADWDHVAKRSFDIVFSVLLLALLWPVMLATAIAVKATSRGPVLFRQKRHGFNNEVIEVLKFRSMYTDQCDPTAKNLVKRFDTRVTPVGRFIRKTTLDELPQFINVLRGELSLVGPRPHAVDGQTDFGLYTEVVDGYFARHRVKPGVTGWAQINGWRGPTDTDEKIRQRTAFDLDYIENWSLFFDLKILLLTPIRLLNLNEAY
ncbi:undecaprenyl-phosphate glucose phosphotransferase [Pararhizobium mangrovi]|uniref:Undecaprenyl-phosphate glucose phosphotransferase n=1 Tax=Pararhizobium mangrovi TaxID=2590452 RepID=A0A506UG23_9HYPH|nr:undecaprenyl-phosphate glucose phosphotransferase [Pararhizobium mangrovi]TPW31909.1 undecaprenyl-phosphate glucose phosphotransferase [Pararhizobium mangrovi]